jgi:microcompartment protein CcmL/EutN
METDAKTIIEGLDIAMKQVGAEEGVIFLKAHYTKAIDALKKQIVRRKNVRLFMSESYYPAGDEQQIIYEVTRRTVPPGGLPKDVGCVVSNVSTLADISRAIQGIPVTERYITVAGAVKNPRTLRVPIGASMDTLPELAGGAAEKDCVYIVGGPCMGEVTETLDRPVTKTTGGLIVLPREHPLLRRKNAAIRYKAMLSVCCQCSMCTQMCPRNALGLGTSPHKAMRSLMYGADLIGDVNSILTCCDCGICTYFACNFELNPAQVMKSLKKEMTSKGLKPNVSSATETDFYIDSKRLSASRLTARLGLGAYDVSAPLEAQIQQYSQVRLPLRMHIGAVCKPLVTQGDRRYRRIYRDKGIEMAAIGTVEILSIPKGILAGDAMLKSASVRLVYAGTVCAGKYVVVVSGGVAEVNASVLCGITAAGTGLIDSLVIPKVDEQVLRAASACGEVGNVAAIGVMELFSVCSCIAAADAAVKAAKVTLIEMRLGRGLGGKSFMLLTGDVSAVRAAVDAARACPQANGMISDCTVLPKPHPDLVTALL